jgi:hypothetical protein
MHGHDTLLKVLLNVPQTHPTSSLSPVETSFDHRRPKQAFQKTKSTITHLISIHSEFASAFTRNFAFAPRHSVGRAALRLSRKPIKTLPSRALYGISEVAVRLDFGR